MLYSFSLCKGSASIPRTQNIVVESSDNIESDNENMREDEKTLPFNFSCTDSMPKM